jgi:hypothetical protein
MPPCCRPKDNRDMSTWAPVARTFGDQMPSATCRSLPTMVPLGRDQAHTRKRRSGIRWGRKPTRCPEQTFAIGSCFLMNTVAQVGERSGTILITGASYMQDIKERLAKLFDVDATKASCKIGAEEMREKLKGKHPNKSTCSKHQVCSYVTL